MSQSADDGGAFVVCALIALLREVAGNSIHASTWCGVCGVFLAVMVLKGFHFYFVISLESGSLPHAEGGTEDDVLLCTTVGCDVSSAPWVTSIFVYEHPRHRCVLATNGHCCCRC